MFTSHGVADAELRWIRPRWIPRPEQRGADSPGRLVASTSQRSRGRGPRWRRAKRCHDRPSRFQENYPRTPEQDRRVLQRWTWKGDDYASGRIENPRIDKLGLSPLPLRGGELVGLRAVSEPYRRPDPYAALCWDEMQEREAQNA